MNIDISDKKIIDFSKIFSSSIFKELSETGESKKLSQILLEVGLLQNIDLKQNLATFFDESYKILSKKYKNEYVYKNTIIKKILLGRHSLNTAFLINECRVGSSKADSVIFNGTSTVYEIKSEYDSFSRLEQQLNDYKKAFEYINIVVPSSSVDKLKDYLKDDYIGIIRLNKNNTLSIIREAKSNKKYFDKSVIFDILNQNEYKAIVKKYFDNVPDVPNTKVYAEYKKYFEQLSIEIIHNEIVKNLKQRGNNKSLKEFIENIPDSLKVLALQTKLTNKAKENLLNLLKKDIKNIV